MKKELYQRYAEIKAEIKKLEEEAQVIAEGVVADMTENELAKVESDLGTFFFTYRKSYTYPDYVKEAEAKFKEAKVKSENIGDAKFTETQSLSFRGK